jgi:hypothetical protein
VNYSTCLVRRAAADNAISFCFVLKSVPIGLSNVNKKLRPREASARVVFSTITIKALIGYKQARFTCNFRVLLFMSKTGKMKVFDCQGR